MEIKMTKVVFKHWQTGDELTRIGKIMHDNPASDRIVLKLDNGKFEDILRNTIVSMKNND